MHASPWIDIYRHREKPNTRWCIWPDDTAVRLFMDVAIVSVSPLIWMSEHRPVGCIEVKTCPEEVTGLAPIEDVG
jgi:hypothetical protein